MKVVYHQETDSLYIELSDKPSVDSQEIKPGIVLDMDDEGNLVGLNIDQASKNVTLSKLEMDSLPVTSGYPEKNTMNVLDYESRKVIHDLGELASGMVNKLHVLRSSRTEVSAKGAYVAFFVRVVRIFRAFAHLAGVGYGPEANLLIRPFYDTLVDWLYIESDPENLGERYVMHQQASQLQWIRDYGKDSDVTRFTAEHGDTAKQFCDKYCEGKNSVPREWIGLNMEEKALKAGLEYYYPIFRDLSNKLHNSPLAMAQYIDVSDPSVLKLKTGPDVSGLGGWIAFMCLGLRLCLQKADEHFELHSESDIVALGEQVLRYANMHGDTSPSTPPLADEACE